MSKPRPPNMFQYPQESTLAPMRDKLLFIEALAASDELTGRELRVAILLTSFYSTTNGYAKPSMDRIAAGLGIDKSAARKAVNSLAAQGWFFVERGNFKLGGKGHVNRYRPNPERVASASPFYDQPKGGAGDPLSYVAPQTPESAKGVKTAPKGVKTPSPKGVARDYTSVDSLPNPRTDTAILRMASHSGNGDATTDSLPPENVLIRQLQGIEKWLKPKLGQTYWRKRDLDSVRAYHAFVDAVFEAYPAHDSNIGGMAYRIVSELSWILDQNGVER